MLLNIKQLSNKFFHLRSNNVYRSILSNASSIIGTTAINSILGLVYWGLATHYFTPSAVGLASVAISAMTLLGTVSNLGLGTWLMGELPLKKDKTASLISFAIIISGVCGGGLGLVFSWLAPYLSPELGSLSQDPLSLLLFVGGVSLTSLSLVLDQAFIGLLRGGLQFWRNLIFALAKLGLLLMLGLVLSGTSRISILATWVIGNGVSLVLVTFLLAGKRWSLKAFWPEWVFLRDIGKTVLGHHLLNLSQLASPLLLPLVVTTVLSTTANAYFYTAWMIASLLLIAVSSFTTVLYTANSALPLDLAVKVRFTLQTATLFGLVGCTVLLLGATWLLAFFGPTYVSQAESSLRLLGLGVFAWIIKSHFVVIGRIQAQFARVTLVTAVAGLLELGSAAIGGLQGGLNGLAAGWLLAVYIEALFMAPAVYRSVTFHKKKPRRAN